MNLELLTVFADYKLPQMLREAGVLQYVPALVERVDTYVLISSGSREEVEIRCAMIWGIELLKQRLQNGSSLVAR